MSGTYVTYWDGSGWQSFVEIMLAKSNAGPGGTYRLQVFDRDGTEIGSQTGSLQLNQTARINLNAVVGTAGTNREGLVKVFDTSGNDDEFVSVLTIRGINQNPSEGNRFIPFTRIE